MARMLSVPGSVFVGVLRPFLRDESRYCTSPTLERVGCFQISHREMTWVVGLFLLSLPISSALAAEHSINLEMAHRSITTNELMQHVVKLASDEFEGRAPGTRGEELTLDYLVAQFRKTGLKPGNPDGTFLQNVP